MTPGRKFSATTSALAMSSSAISLPFGILRSSAMLRLLRLEQICSIPWPSCQMSPLLQWRCQAPSGGSTAITSAPRSASAWMPIGPNRKWLKLITRMPCSRSSIGELFGVEEMQVGGGDRRLELRSGRKLQIRIHAGDADIGCAEPNDQDLLVAELFRHHRGCRLKPTSLAFAGGPSRMCWGRMPMQTDCPTREPEIGKAPGWEAQGASPGSSARRSRLRAPRSRQGNSSPASR